MFVATDKSITFGAKVNLIRPDCVVAEWTHRSIIPNEQHLYIAAKYVEADRANENKHFWSFEDLQKAQSTIRNSPINVMHSPHSIVGVMIDQELIYPDALARDFSSEEREKLANQNKALPDGSYPIANKEDLKNAIQAYGRAKNKSKVKSHIIKRAKALGATDLLPDDWKSSSAIEQVNAYDYTSPFVEMLGVLWKWQFPQTVAQIEAAQEMGALWVSMECKAETVTRVDNDGTEHEFPFMGGNIKAYDFHADSSHVQLNKPHFVGCGLVLPPAKPGWKGAEVKDLIAAIDQDDQEAIYNQIATDAPHLTPEQWEDLMVTILAGQQS